MNDKTFEKINIKLEVTVINVPANQVLVSLENIRFWDQICPKKNINEKSFGKNKH